MDKAQFWTQKPIIAQYESIKFSHPSFDAPIYLVANQFAAVTLGGVEHTPCPLAIQPPAQSKDGNPSITLSFPRVVVGAAFKRQLALIDRHEPITVEYKLYFADDLNTAAMAYTFYVDKRDGITMNGEAVNVKATYDNPMRRAVCRIYDPATFTGLKNL